MLLPVLLGLTVGLVFALWWIYRIDKIYGASDFTRAERSINWFTVFTLLCGLVEFLAYDSNLPALWLAFASAAQWEKYKWRRRRASSQ